MKDFDMTQQCFSGLPTLALVLRLVKKLQMPERLTGADGSGESPYEENRFRQYSIGYHEERSDPSGEECECPCHQLTLELLLEALEEALERISNLGKRNRPDQQGTYTWVGKHDEDICVSFIPKPLYQSDTLLGFMDLS